MFWADVGLAGGKKKKKRRGALEEIALFAFLLK